jgi:hypothetical protein
MSYLHCPTSGHAYNLAVTSQCPSCPVTATVVDPEEDIIAAADALARAMARATPAERKAAAARISSLVPAPAVAPTWRSQLARKPQAAPSVMAPPSPRLLTRLAESLVGHAEGLVIALVPRARRFRDRVRALAA